MPKIVFWCAAVFTLLFYMITSPGCLPWAPHTRLELAYLGEIAPLAEMAHPIWGYLVQVFGGAIALAVLATSLASGLVGNLVARYFGWRVAACAVIAWTFSPPVWNRAITGEASACLVSLAVASLWAANIVVRFVFRNVMADDADGDGSEPAMGTESLDDSRMNGESARIPADDSRHSRRNRILAWLALALSGVFALVSLTLHDYSLGRPAGVFAKGVVEDAAGRIIVMNGVCDDQLVRELRARRGTAADDAIRFVSLRDDDCYRNDLAARVRREFPADTNLWAAAQIGPSAFANLAIRVYPHRFYAMDGKSTTLERWDSRWRDFAPMLKSTDRFVAAARRQFGREGNAVANALGDRAAAWRVYKRIYDEVDPGNFSSLVNMNELIREGFSVGDDELKCVESELEKAFRRAGSVQRMREIAYASGPIRSDPERIERLAQEARRRIAEKVAAGEDVDVSPEFLTLVEWNNEMIALLNRGDLVRSARVARKILSNPKWRGFLAANAVMGTVAASEGDYALSERFFATATDTTNAVPPAVLNDYADTLMHLGRLGEAESLARRAVAETDESFWLARLTLAEVLESKRDPAGDAAGACARHAEIRALVKAAMKHAPEHVRDEIRRKHIIYLR